MHLSTLTHIRNHREGFLLATSCSENSASKHANLKYKYGNRKFWAEGYYVSTVGLNEATIVKYIREQEKHDIAVDRLSVREYEDPVSRKQSQLSL